MNLGRLAAVILNRNLGKVCDSLVEDLKLRGVSEIFVVDASSSPSLRSKNATLTPQDSDIISKGLRINRGYNLGLGQALIESNADWILCLPVDTEIDAFHFEKLLLQLERYPKVVAVCPLEVNSPYLPLVPQSGLAIAWKIPEGPVFLRSDFVRDFQVGDRIRLFDDENFRGYLSFVELALRIYGNDSAFGISSLIQVHEREDYLLNFADLMKTEPLEINKYLLVWEGLTWLKEKYGLVDRWSFENMVRLVYEDFVSKNPRESEIAIY